ncbi:MAG: 1-deoxy-D-xylulose-5-phosphate reductoisomerase [Candidatus Dormibacteraceae bacterium]
MSERLRIVILGASGSIGSQALEVIDRYPQHFEITGLVTARAPLEARREPVLRASEADSAARIEELVTGPNCDLVLVAIPGATVLVPTLAALGAGKMVALATKEVLVMAGRLVMAAAAQPSFIRPVDSEHSAIWQCLWGESPASVARLILTASGGPFWSSPELDWGQVSVAEATKHPRWSMGPKVSVDSATLMNKGLELIEAHHLFQVGLDRIDVLIHPQSVIHSMVEFCDGSIKAQLSHPDMRIPIALGLSYPRRLPGVVSQPALVQASPLELQWPDPKRFPALHLAREAARLGGAYPAVLNAANEAAVAAFLAGGMRLSEVVPAAWAALDAFSGGGDSLTEILLADEFGRESVARRLGTL